MAAAMAMNTTAATQLHCSSRKAQHSVVRAFRQRLQQRRQRRQQLAAPAVAAAATTLAETGTIRIGVKMGREVQRAQQAVLDAVDGVQGRGKGGMSPEQQEQFEAAVAVLEADGGVQGPTTSPLLDGRWRLLYTTRPGSASPIQRTFTAVDSFSVYQDIELSDLQEEARVSQVVDFGPAIGFLRVEAEANVDSRPLPGFSPRTGEGLPFGIMGRSSTEPPTRPDMRVGFQFDRAAFTFKLLPFKIPYPVPFKLLGDERKGWLDVTYLSPDGRLRLSRGNKGTLFVLAKDVPVRDQMFDALARQDSDAEIERLAEQMQASGEGERNPAASPLAAGTWRLVWSKQGKTANRFQKALAGQVENFQIITEDGRLDNLVCLAPGVRVRASASCSPEEADTRTRVDIDGVTLELGSLKLPLPIKPDGRGFVEWLYLDEGFRITRGNKGSVFMHTREP